MRQLGDAPGLGLRHGAAEVSDSVIAAMLAGMTTWFAMPLVASGTSPVRFAPVAGAAVAVALAIVWRGDRTDPVRLLRPE